MPQADPQYITALLEKVNQGEGGASEQLFPLIYDQLHSLAARIFSSEQPDHTLQATALLNEAYIRMVGGASQQAHWHGRRHFFAVAAKAMRSALIDHARRAGARKRKGVLVTLSGNEPSEEAGYDLIELVDAISELSKVNERVAQIVELRFLGGLTVDEAAEELGISRRTAFVDWRAGRAWLREHFDVRREAE